MPSLNADGSLRPDILWNPRSPVVLVSAVDLEAMENRFRKDGVAKLPRVAICSPEVVIGWLSALSAPEN
jgi:hypothetical protein